MTTMETIEVTMDEAKNGNTPARDVTGIKKVFRFLAYALVWAFVLSLALGSFAAGVWTVIPTELLAWGSSKANLLGYISHCPFVPISSLTLFAASSIGIFLAYKLRKRERVVGLGLLLGMAGGMAIGLLGGIDIGMFMGMGAGVGVGIALSPILGILLKREV
ncbi:MAG: hypothetical protein JSW05_05655 [Candidatus Thorarchaeota archaeon]|nr:MAG: hypothetical protein JSW05_05655 [Candidatus Thorarchaeota archaeon]